MAQFAFRGMGCDIITLCNFESCRKKIKNHRNHTHSLCYGLCGHIHSAREYKITENLMQISTSSGLIGACREIIIK